MKDDYFESIMIGLMLAFAGFCFGAYVIDTIKDDKGVQVEAVERGLAEWRINDEGKVQWGWRERHHDVRTNPSNGKTINTVTVQWEE